MIANNTDNGYSRLVLPILLAAALLIAGCATPMGVRRVTPQESYVDSQKSPLTDDAPSNATTIILQRFNLTNEFSSQPAIVIKQLHAKALHDERNDILYALAELSYLYGEQLVKSDGWDETHRAPGYFLLAASYAYLFLFDDHTAVPDLFDIRTRTAYDLYNVALWRGMATGIDGTIRLKSGVRKLPVGSLDVTLDLRGFPFRLEDFSRLEPVDNYAIRGISIRNRTKGVGSALIGVKKQDPQSISAQPVPLTMFLELNGDLRQLTEGQATATLHLYSAFEDNKLEVNGRHLPIETDTTTPLAYGLESSKVWDFGLGAFFGKEFISTPNGLHLIQPYQPGRIPVVFVHGTFSNPAWWAEMFNTLYADPILRQYFQFWFFLYNSSAPVLVSAADLRDGIREKVAGLDPDGKDPALQEMVVVGHSQGGLLTKLTAVDTGEQLIEVLTGKSLEELKLPAEQDAKLRHYLMVQPVMEVRRVVFISTPHRGSILTKNWIRTLIQKLVTLPVKMVETVLTLDQYLTDDVRRTMGGGNVPTSIDGMSPDNPVLKTLADTPLASGVIGHSVIAIKGDDEPPEGDDGVVAYTSAHLEGMDSELIVRSGHSCQSHPFTIEEVRRILLEHLHVVKNHESAPGR